MAFFKKKMSDKDFKIMLENEAIEQREAKANINDFLSSSNGSTKKAPMVLTADELLGVNTPESDALDTNAESIEMAGEAPSTQDFLFKKMLEAREEQTKAATAPKKEEPKVKENNDIINESIEDILKRMEEKAQNEVNNRYGYSSTHFEAKKEPVVSAPVQKAVSSTLDGILEDILEPKKETAVNDFNVESLIEDMKADVGIYEKEEKSEPNITFSSEANEKLNEIIEEVIEEDTAAQIEVVESEQEPEEIADDAEQPVSDNIQQINETEETIIDDEEFVDAEDIVENYDINKTEEFKTSVFASIKEQTTFEDISSGLEEDDDDDEYEEDEEEFDEYLSRADKDKTLKLINKGKAFSIISLLLSIASLVLAALGEFFLTDIGENLILASAVTFALAVLLNTNLLKAFGKMFTGKLLPDFAVATVSILAIIYNFLAIYAPSLLLISFAIASPLPIIITEIIRLGKYSRILKGFNLIANDVDKNALVFSQSASAKDEACKQIGFEQANICLPKKAQNIIGFVKNTFTRESGGYTVGIISLFGFAFAIAAAVGGYYSEVISPISCFMAIALLIATPAAVLINELPLKVANKRLKFYGSSIFGEKSANQLDSTNCVNIHISDVFPAGTVKLMDFKLLSPNPIDQTLLDAAALTRVAKSPLAGIFKQITDETDEEKDLPVDTVVYEERMGISGWVNDKRVFVGNRTLMEAHGFRVPSLEVDKKVLQRGYFPVYLGSENVLCALLIVKYTAHPDVALELKRFASTGASILINNCDQNVTAEMVEDYLGLYEDSVYITSRGMQKTFEKEMTKEENVEAPAVVGNSVCGLVSTITAAIRIKKLSKAISVLYVILTICLLAGLVSAIFLGQFSFISSITIAISLLASSIICALPPYIYRP